MVRSGASKFAARFQLRAAPPFSWKTSCRKADKQLGNEHVFQIARGIKTTRVRGPPPSNMSKSGLKVLSLEAPAVIYGALKGRLASIRGENSSAAAAVNPEKRLFNSCALARRLY